jgi:hypothetical protein
LKEAHVAVAREGALLRRLIVAVATLAFTAGSMIGVTGTASAATQYSIKNYNGLCMDIGSNAPGTVVGITYCGPLTSQRWYQFPDKTIRNFNGLCMDIGSNAPGTKVGLAYCRPGYTSQQWTSYYDHTIRNSNGLCMDIGSDAPGTPVGITTCQPNFTSQKWAFLE